MATFAFLPAPMTGHVNPFLGIARELSGQGHRVVFYLPEEHRRAVEAVGAELRVILLRRDRHHRPGDDATTRFALAPMWLTDECRTVLPAIEEDVRALAPDVLGYDMLCVWGRLLARLLPVPAALVVGSYVGNEHFSPIRTRHYQAMSGHLADAFPAYAADVAALGAAYGLELRPRDLFARDERLVLVVMSRAFHPAGETFDSRFRFVGAALRPAGCDPAGAAPELPPGRPVVYVSFGTLVAPPPGLVATCVESFADGAWEVVLVLGDTPVPADLPPTVHAVDRAPQLELLSRAGAFVTHGGTNSVMEALCFEVPMVVLPEAPEHAITGDRVAELGVGMTLDPRTVTAARLRAAVDEVAGDPAVRERLRRLGAATRADGGAPAAARALADLVG